MDNVHKRVAVLFVIGEKTQSLKALQQTNLKKKKKLGYSCNLTQQ